MEIKKSFGRIINGSRKWIKNTDDFVEFVHFIESITSELAEPEVKTAEANFMQTRELTDEEWMKLPDEMINEQATNKAAIHSNLGYYEGYYDGAKWALSLKAQEKGELPLDLENAWPTKDVLNKLIWATEYLLHKKDYDGVSYEELEFCVKRGKKILESLKAQPEIDINTPFFGNTGAKIPVKAQPGDEDIRRYFDKWIIEAVGIQDADIFYKGTLVRDVAIRYAIAMREGLIPAKDK